MKAIGKLIRGLFKVVLLPFRLLVRSGLVFTRVVLTLALIPLRVSRAMTRVLGVRAVVLGIVGFAVGLLVAPVPGRQLREKLLALLAGGGAVPDDELADKVTFELSHAPRTWHLEPQPDVSVLGGRVVLSGEVRGEDARDEFARVAAAIPGVVAVDNQLDVVAVGVGESTPEPASAD